MLRYGNKEAHGYILGVYSQKKMAKDMGKLEEINRAGKFEPKIIPFFLNIDFNNIKEKKLTKRQQKILWLAKTQLNLLFDND